MVLTTLMLSTFFVPALCSQKANEISDKIVWKVQVVRHPRSVAIEGNEKGLHYGQLTYLGMNDVLKIRSFIPEALYNGLYLPIKSYAQPTVKVKCPTHPSGKCFDEKTTQSIYKLLEKKVTHIPFDCFYDKDGKFKSKDNTLYLNSRAKYIDKVKKDHDICLEIQLASDFGNDCPHDYHIEMSVKPHYFWTIEFELCAAGIIEKKDGKRVHGPFSLFYHFDRVEEIKGLKATIAALEEKQNVQPQQQQELSVVKQASSEEQVILDVVTPEQSSSNGENQKLEEEISFLRSQMRIYQLAGISIGLLALILYILHGPLPVAA
jgi:hypothetical protein